MHFYSKVIASFLFIITVAFNMDAEDSLYMKTLYHWDGATGDYNDVWGYAINGAEIAIIGSSTKIHFFDVSNPGNISLIHEEIGGVSTIWRDMKSYGNYVYAASDASTEGLHIFDMSAAPASVTKVLTTTAFFDKAHNIFIDEANARLYACGTDSQAGGLVVLDLSTPENPTLLSSVNVSGGYIHDLYVSNNIAYCNSGYDGYFIIDFTDPVNPVDLGSYTYANQGYNHSSWNTPDNAYAIFAEELPRGKPMRILDISDPSSINLMSTWKEPLLAPVREDNTPHNPIILGNWAYISYYQDGIQIIDISDKSNPTRVAYYDTSDNTVYNGTQRVWGVYPMLPSGIILASDINTGLYILDLDFSIPIPVQLTQFEAGKSNHGKHSLLQWKTSSEIANKQFNIERSFDGKHFVSIGSLEGQFNSNEETQYAFVDYHPQRGHNFYRLKQIDHSGNINYSDVRLVSFDANNPSVKIYPNPGDGQSLSVNFDSPFAGDYRLILMDGHGKHIYSEQFRVDQNPVSKQIEMGFVQNLPGGAYHLVIYKDGQLYKTFIHLVN